MVILKWTIVVEVVVFLGLLAVYCWWDSSPAVSEAPPDEPGVAEIPQRWTDEPLGALGEPAIIVQKSTRLLTVLDRCKPVKTYRITVGNNLQDKRIEGDLCTPEGEFYICTKQGPGKTRFYRSFGLSYPNIEDAERGLADGTITQSHHDSITRAIQAGQQPPWKTPLGGEIMIHGCKNGRAGTLGCVALDNADMLELFSVLQIDTPVKIIP